METKKCSTVDFETAFSEFIDRKEYDDAENALFSMVRISFRAGWLAAGGKPPKSSKAQNKVLELFRKPLAETPIKDYDPD